MYGDISRSTIKNMLKYQYLNYPAKTGAFTQQVIKFN